MKRVLLFRALLIGGLLCLGLMCAVGAEWGARYYERHRTVPPDYFPQMYYPHQRLGYGLIPNFDYYGWFRINSLGFRGREVTREKSRGMLRIVCLGGSTTFDIGSIGEARPWPEVLEAQLRRLLGTDSVEVLNLGIPGSNSLDSLIDLQIRALDLKPDLLIVYQGLNDFVYSAPVPEPARSKYYPLEEVPRSSFIRWLRIHSVLFAKTEGRVGALLSRLWPQSKNQRVDDGGASLERGLKRFRANMASIAAVAQSNRVPLVLPEVVLPFPQGAPPDCGMCARLSSVLGNIDPQKMKSMFERYGAALPRGPGVYPIVTVGFVPREDSYYHDPVHFGPEGSRQMGMKLADALLPLLNSGKGIGNLGNGETKLP